MTLIKRHFGHPEHGVTKHPLQIAVNYAYKLCAKMRSLVHESKPLIFEEFETITQAKVH